MQKLIKPSIENNSYISSYKFGHYDISQTQLEEPIKYFRIYVISTKEDEEENKNISHFFEDSDFAHWFLIAITDNNKYYVIQKGEDGNSISYFDDEDEAKNSVRENYHYNDIEFMEEYELNEKINIKNIFGFIKNDYNLIDDNSQNFIRNILNHYYFK